MRQHNSSRYLKNKIEINRYTEIVSMKQGAELRET